MTEGVTLIDDGRVALGGFPAGDIVLRRPKIGEYKRIRKHWLDISGSTPAIMPLEDDAPEPPVVQFWRFTIEALAGAEHVPEHLDDWPLWCAGATTNTKEGALGALFDHWLTVPLARTAAAQTA